MADTAQRTTDVMGTFFSANRSVLLNKAKASYALYVSRISAAIDYRVTTSLKLPLSTHIFFQAFVWHTSIVVSACMEATTMIQVKPSVLNNRVFHLDISVVVVDTIIFYGFVL